MYMGVFARMHCATHVEVIGQLAGVSSLLPPCAFWRSGSGHEAWQQAPYPTELF